MVSFRHTPPTERAPKCNYLRWESRSLRASLSAVTVCLPLRGAEGQFKSSEVPRAPSAPPSEMGIFCSFFFFLSLDLVFQCLCCSLQP